MLKFEGLQCGSDIIQLAMSSRLGTPQIGDFQDIDEEKLERVKQKYEALLDQALQRINPRKILVAPCYRNGAPPNLLHLEEILKSIDRLGLDVSKFPVGVCIKYETPEGKRKLLEHNMRFSSKLPPIDENLAQYGSIACSHLNLALRIIQGLEDAPTLQDAHLQATVTEGLEWLVLPENLDVRAYQDLDFWRALMWQ